MQWLMLCTISCMRHPHTAQYVLIHLHAHPHRLPAVNGTTNPWCKKVCSCCAAGNLFFKDYSGRPTQERMGSWDRKFTLLKSLPNVLVTPHIAFFTREALSEIAATTRQNLRDWVLGRKLANEVKTL